MNNNFKNKVVIISGASSGIGKSLAIQYSKAGAFVACLGRRKERLDETVESCKAHGGNAKAYQCDVTQTNSVSVVVEQVLKEFSKIDVVVANAGFAVMGPLEKLSIEDYARQFETNVFGVLRLIKASLASLQKSSGKIIILGSVTGEIAMPGSSPYSMSKHAVHSLADSLSAELASDKITVTLVIPGYVESEIHQIDNDGKFDPRKKDPVPSSMMMSSDLAAKKIICASISGKRILVLGFQTKMVILINCFFPWLIRTLRKMKII